MPGYDFNRARMGLPQQQMPGMLPPPPSLMGMQWGPTGGLGGPLPMGVPQGGGNWLTGVGGAAKKAGNWLMQDDNLLDVASLGLGAFGAYKQGKQQDEQVRDERRRRDEETERQSGAAALVAPILAQMMAQRRNR
jgi:hypothetical protein